MTARQPVAGQLAPVATLAIPARIASALPTAVREELALLPSAQQDQFVEAFRTRSRSLLVAYLTSLIYCHYALLGQIGRAHV